MKKIIIGLTSLLTLSLLTIGALAASPTAIDNLSKLINVSPQEITERLEEGERPRDLAQEYGVIDQFIEIMNKHREERLQLHVENGRLTQEEADARLQAMNENRENCMGEGFNFRFNQNKATNNQQNRRGK